MVRFVDRNGIDRRVILTGKDLREIRNQFPVRTFGVSYKLSNPVLRGLIDQETDPKRKKHLKDLAKGIYITNKSLEQINLAWRKAVDKGLSRFQEIFSFVWRWIANLKSIGNRTKELTLKKLDEIHSLAAAVPV
jgi:hypothetical protein